MSGFTRSAGYYAMITGIAGLLYSISFVILKSPLLSGLFLLIGGLAGTAALVGVYRRLRSADEGMALWGVVLGLTGALGSAIHAAYDLAIIANPPAALNQDLPSAIDPRGFLTFGIAGLALVVLSLLIVRSGRLARPLGYLGLVSGALLVLIYLGRLIVLDPGSPLILGPAALEGFIVNPLWYIWLGVNLMRAGGDEKVAVGYTRTAE